MLNSTARRDARDGGAKKGSFAFVPHGAVGGGGRADCRALGSTEPNDAQQQWQQLNAQVMEAYQAGDYAKGVASAEQALQLARKVFGARHPDTLQSLNNLAMLYQAQGRYGEAEPLLKEALQGYRETLEAADGVRDLA
jgi:tetratricopeptide (TPR) repeat protein